MASPPRPVVRSLILCEEVVPDAANPNRVSLMHVISAIGPVAGATYPVIRPRLGVFAQLTACRGQGPIWVELRQADTDRVVFRSRSQSVRFPDDPLAVNGATIRLRNLVFPVPGLYWVQLWFDNTVIGVTPLRLK
jgi:hypothetical protein